MKKAYLLYVIFILGCSFNRAGINNIENNECEDFTIYRTFLKDKYPEFPDKDIKIWLYNKTTFSWRELQSGEPGTLDEYKNDTYLFLKRNVPITEDTYHNFITNNDHPISLKSFHLQSQTIHLLNNKEWNQSSTLFIKDPMGYYNKYSIYRIGPWKLSRVGFNKTHNQALLYIEGGGGNSYFIFYEKQNDSWKRVKNIPVKIT